MRKRNVTTFIILFLANISILCSQNNTCETAEKSFEDLNSITKCTVEKKEKTSASGKKSRQLSVRISSSQRFLKRRAVPKDKASGLGTMSTSGVDANNASVGITSNSLSIKEANTISKLKEKLSKEQLNSALGFEELDQIPLFSSCKVKSFDESYECFNETMMNHIMEHFRYPQDAVLNKVQGNVWVRFVIDEEGNITNLKTLAPKNGELLQQEAERVISKLTAFVPAVKDGKKVIAKYGFPINFSLED